MGAEALEGRTADCPLSDSDAFIPGTKCAPAHLGDVLVLGLGVSGKSAARYCAALVGTRVDRLFVAAGARNDDSEAFLKSIEGPNVSWDFGDAALEGFTDRFDVCIASPGIPFYHELYVAGQALSNELISEVEFSWRESAADSVWVAITGTNGKTTTTSCAAHILKEAGLAAAAVGNIGDVCLDAVQSGEVDVFVAEVSSYQLYSTRLFAPDVAVMLNITPDHLHWHRTLEAYRDAKFQLLDNMTKRGCQPAVDGATIGKVGAPTCPVAVLDAVNDVVRARVRAYRTMTLAERGFSYIPLGTKAGFQGDMRVACGSDNSAFIDETGVFHIAYQGVEHCAGTVADLQIKGAHNASNALAAAAVAVALGVSDADIARALASFAPLEHRIEPCGTLAGRRTSTLPSRRSNRSPDSGSSCCWEATTRTPSLQTWWMPCMRIRRPPSCSVRAVPGSPRRLPRQLTVRLRVLRSTRPTIWKMRSIAPSRRRSRAMSSCFHRPARRSTSSARSSIADAHSSRW